MLQVAAATNCKHHYGVEKADIPAKYAEVSGSGDVDMCLCLFHTGGGGVCQDGEREGRQAVSVGAPWCGTRTWGPARCVSIPPDAAASFPPGQVGWHHHPASAHLGWGSVGPGQWMHLSSILSAWSISLMGHMLVASVSWKWEPLLAPQCAPWGPTILSGWVLMVV